MDRVNPNIKKVLNAKDWYRSISDSAVSWRRKSSYRKSIKRLTSKLARRVNNRIIESQIQSKEIELENVTLSCT